MPIEPDRGAAPVPFRRRSRLVAGAKVVLPLAALGLLSTVFLLARDQGGPRGLPYADLEQIAREPRMDRPRLAGVAPDGTAVALEAERVALVPGRQAAFALEAPELRTEAPRGASATLTARDGEVDSAAGTLRLRGGVALETSAGYRLEAPALSADLGSGTLEAGPVTGEGPLGRIEAGAMILSQGQGEGARLVFNRGVRVLYQPETEPEDLR